MKVPGPTDKRCHIFEHVRKACLRNPSRKEETALAFGVHLTTLLRCTVGILQRCNGLNASRHVVSIPRGKLLCASVVVIALALEQLLPGR